MKVYLNRSIAGLGEWDELVDVEDGEYADNLVKAGFADKVGADDDDAPPFRLAQPGLGPVPDADDKAALVAYAEALGVEVRKSWSANRVHDAIVARLEATTSTAPAE